MALWNLVAEVQGPTTALRLVDGLADDLAGYHLLHATRATLLEQTGRSVEAYQRAADLAPSPAAVEFLYDRRDRARNQDMPPPPRPGETP